MENLNQNSPSTSDSPSPVNKPGVYFTQQPQNTEGPKPIHLIYYNQQEKTFRVSEEAKEFLSSIKERVGVISVAGKYRTGKSFLLNRVIINKKNSGFGVGPTINPCTKGLWIWGDTLEGEYQGEKLKVLLIDSEGIGAFDEDENHDTKIFLLALLLSSHFIYNSMGTIDENAINNLSLIVNLSKELQIKSELVEESDPDEIAKYFPSFLWVVRDFSLRLHDTMGNQLTPKEYLENAIQPQKGTSDQIETKNRIRRLIKHFFKDRDCFTMVRPVEEEKHLQSLQSLTDDMLRGEFVQQVKQLRTKIFKRTRPKTLNSKFITGEMLLELCYSYTEAINHGSVPNIQNAWSYVCQNECQRAINDSISAYEHNMRKILDTAKKLCNEDLVRKEHKIRRDEAVQVFKSKAVGQDIQDFESQLREGVSKKYKDIKNDFLRYCKSKAHSFLEEDITVIKRNIQNDIYENLDKFKEDLDRLKQKYNEQGPNFSGKGEIFTEISLNLMAKASDFLTITSKKESDVTLKKLKERVLELEQEKSTLKQEFIADRKALEEKIYVLEQDKNNSIRNEKLLEERMKYISEDKEKLEKALNEKWKRKLEDKEEQLRLMDAKAKNLELQVKQKEDEGFKKSNEFDKLNALIEQKLQLTENELSEYKNKYAVKDQDYKEINKELYNSRKEVQQLTNQMHRLEQEKADEIKQLKVEYDNQISEMQRQVNTGSSGNPQVSEDLQNQWNKERQHMQIQMKILAETLEAQKKMQETLLQAISNNKYQSSSPDRSKNEQKMKEKNKELLITNQNLSQQIVQMQNKQMNLEKMISNLKQFKYMIHYAIAIQCKNCNKLYPKNQYTSHLPSCNRENERMSNINAQLNIFPLEIIITNCQKQGENFIYEVQVEKQQTQWKVQRKIAEFRILFEELYNQFPTYSLPYIPDEWLQNARDDFYLSDLKKKLQIFMLDLARIPFIRENHIFKQFLEIEQNCPDDDYETRRMFQSMGPTTMNSLSTNFTSNGTRSSVLNPFVSSNSQNMIMVNQSKTMDGRKSVSPMLHQSVNANSNILHQQQENISGAARKQAITGQSLFNMKEQIQELVEDEDYSSMASNNRISQMMQDDIMSSRPSVFSIKNQEIKIDTMFNSKTGSSPFQQADVFGSSKSKERYSNVKNQGYYEGENPGVGGIMEEQDFEDSFTNEIGDMSLSSKKHGFNEDDLLYLQQSSQHRQDENSPPSIDFTKTKANLAKRFENENSALSSSYALQKKYTNRYHDEEQNEDSQDEDGNEDRIQPVKAKIVKDQECDEDEFQRE